MTMTDYEQQELTKYEIDSASKDLKLAGDQNQELVTESRRIYTDLYDKILLYSAGAFSFSATLIGLVVSNRTAALAKIGLIFPNVYWLYASMAFYLLTCFLIFLAKRFDAQYIAVFGMANYTKKYMEKEEAMLRAYNILPMLITKNGTKEGEITTSKSNVRKLSKAYEENDQKRKLYYKIMYYSHLVAEGTVITGTILLLLFVIQLSQAIIWG